MENSANGGPPYISRTMPLHHGMRAASPAEKVTRLWTGWQDKAWLFPFAFDRFVAGHNATDYHRWVSTNSEYMVKYTKGYEPWFIMSRKHMPSYDTRFRQEFQRVGICSWKKGGR
ncbi:hypothetical protein Vafri_8479 [Volvox africanus]|uniref:Uncharacterized protein n=1 Tax=Volvox africanus TaxID=51714 RepID=A0A8J4B3A9_9CHLO|nr:hypothetical protein Vafri_8479 [Volvox africanus]